LGRFVTPDWAAKAVAVPYADFGNPQSLNLYTYGKNNPMTFSDPDGHLADFYDDHANHIGTDGNNDHRNYVVFNHDQAQAIRQQTAAGQNVTQTPASAVLMPGAAVKTAINNAVAASNAPSGNDTHGGNHEEGGVFGTNAQGNQIASPAQPGPYSDLHTATHASIDVGNAVNPATSQSMNSVDGMYHVHPSGTLDDHGVHHEWTQPPSQPDRDSALNSGTNIVVGARDHRVYFYNSAGDIGSMSMRDFQRVP
jgi:hypothetical protein